MELIIAGRAEKSLLLQHQAKVVLQWQGNGLEEKIFLYTKTKSTYFRTITSPPSRPVPLSPPHHPYPCEAPLSLLERPDAPSGFSYYYYPHYYPHLQPHAQPLRPVSLALPPIKDSAPPLARRPQFLVIFHVTKSNCSSVACDSVEHWQMAPPASFPTEGCDKLIYL